MPPIVPITSRGYNDHRREAPDVRIFLPVEDVPRSADRKTLLDLKGAPHLAALPVF
jgi:hypothetical protein